MQMKDAISQRIKKLCTENNITINRLAELSAIAPTTLKDTITGKIEKPNVVLVYKICKTLKITLKEFFDNDIFKNDFDD